MSISAAVRRVGEGRRKALLWQRRLWLAELALWPAAILLAVALSAGAWLLWRRAARRRDARPDARPDVDARTATPRPERANAGLGS